jgi:hypothetical protein
MAALRRVNHGEKVSGELVIPGSDAAEVFQLGEEAFDLADAGGAQAELAVATQPRNEKAA